MKHMKKYKIWLILTIVAGVVTIGILGLTSKQVGLASILATNPRNVLASKTISDVQLRQKIDSTQGGIDVKNFKTPIDNQESPKHTSFISSVKEIISKNEMISQENNNTAPTNSDTVQGFISIFHEDDLAHKKSNDRAVLFAPGNRVISLDYNVLKKFLPETGDYVKLDGLVKTSGDKYSFTKLETISKSTINSNRSASSPTGSASIVIFNYLDNQSVPITTTDARKKLFDVDPVDHFSIPQWFSTVSYGLMNLVGKKSVSGNGDVYGIYTAPYNNSSCQNVNSAVTSVLSNAKAAGLNISENDIVIFIQPYNQNCGYLGFATYMPISPGDPQSKLFRYVLLNDTGTGVFLHELGHLMSNINASFVPHANRYNCKDGLGRSVSIGKLTTASCEIEEYADLFDVMGGVPSNYDYFNNSSRSDAGFLNASNYINVQSSGTYTATPINDVATKIIKIPVTVYNPNGTMFASSESFYTIETRRFDPLVEKYPNNPGANELFIRQGNRLVTVGSGSNILHQGDTFVDEKNQVSIKNLGPASAGSANTLVQVTVPQQPLVCHLGVPKLTISPKPSIGIYPQGVILNAKLKNTDAGACPPINLSLDFGDLRSLYPAYPANIRPQLLNNTKLPGFRFCEGELLVLVHTTLVDRPDVDASQITEFIPDTSI
jgi:hypothetical protein